MDLYDLANPAERMLADKADAMRLPLGGSLELTPLCNMNCRMCYIRLTREQMEARGRMLSCDEWLRIAEEAKERGVLYLLLTGGEPLLFPEFERLYQTLKDMGFIITVNTNGTLLDEYWADIFAERPCKRVNITLYGADNETYEKLCGNPNGFAQVMRAAELLKERDLLFRFNCSVTPENVGQLGEIAAAAKRFDAPLEPCSYMFPPVHKPEEEKRECRMDPKRAAQSQMESFLVRSPKEAVVPGVLNTLRMLELPKRKEKDEYRGLTCRAGRSGFWISWKGELLPCGMFEEPKISLLEHSFSEGWDYIVQETAKIEYCSDCRKCPKRRLCKSCGASCFAESGSFAGRPQYLCEMTDELIRILAGYLPEEEKEKYTAVLRACGCCL